MIKILKVGKTEFKKTQCQSCQTLFAFDKYKDARYDEAKFRYYIHCPVCKLLIFETFWKYAEKWELD